MPNFLERVQRKSTSSAPMSPTEPAMPYNIVNSLVLNFIDFDEEVYQLWIKGLSVEEAAEDQLKKDDVQEFGADFPKHVSLRRIVTRDVCDHFRTFTELEKLVIQPVNFAMDNIYQMILDDKKAMVQLYYELDDVVVREILCKKLSARNRKDLDEVAEKTGINLRSCRRQFDNVKRIVKHVDESPGPLIQTILNAFLIQNDIAERYAAIVFLVTNKFDISKKKLNYITFENFFSCADVMVNNWLISANGASSASKYATDEYSFDKDFLLQFRDVKSLSDREKEHKSLCLCELRKVGGCSVSEAETNFKFFSRPILSIASQLHTPKEMRDFFVDIVEKVLEPARNIKWNKDQLEVFLTAFHTAGTLLLHDNTSLSRVWQCYMKVISVCVVQLYHT